MTMSIRRQPHHDEALQTDLPDGQITLSSTRLRIVACPVPFAKIFLFFRNRIACMVLVVSSLEGALAIVTDAGRDAVDAAAPLTNGAQADGEVVWS
jgi:hypothetical protein